MPIFAVCINVGESAISFFLAFSCALEELTRWSSPCSGTRVWFHLGRQGCSHSATTAIIWSVMAVRSSFMYNNVAALLVSDVLTATSGKQCKLLQRIWLQWLSNNHHDSSATTSLTTGSTNTRFKSQTNPTNIFVLICTTPKQTQTIAPCANFSKNKIPQTTQWSQHRPACLS